MQYDKNSEGGLKKPIPIIDDGKSSELIEAEMEVLGDDGIDIDAGEMEMIKQDAESPEEAAEIIEAERKVVKRKAAVKKAREKIDKATPSNALTQRPSGGQTRAKGEIHMRHVYALMIGRRGFDGVAPIPGLYAAAKQANLLTREYRRGCLYAAKFLIDTEAELANLKERFRIKQKENDRFLSSLTLMKIEPYVSSKPAEPEWMYFSPYSWHYTELLLEYDLLLRKAYPYYSMRLIDRKDFEQRVLSLSRDLRRLFAMNMPYYFVGPESFRKKDAVYLQAVTDFGELDKDIIERKVAPKMVEIPKQFL